LAKLILEIVAAQPEERHEFAAEITEALQLPDPPTDQSVQPEPEPLGKSMAALLGQKPERPPEPVKKYTVAPKAGTGMMPLSWDDVDANKPI
jgi:hypothetical protein